jgi:hypothetical protein
MKAGYQDRRITETQRDGSASKADKLNFTIGMGCQNGRREILEFHFPPSIQFSIARK